MRSSSTGLLSIGSIGGSITKPVGGGGAGLPVRLRATRETIRDTLGAMRTVALALLLALVAASAAHAQVAEGRRRLGLADFTRAIRAFDRAERAPHLTREDLIAIYEGRAMARWATGHESQAGRDLAALAEIDPHHGFPPEAPPELGRAFDDAARAGGLALEITFADETGATTVEVDAQRDGAGLVRSIRLHTRVADGAWAVADASSARLGVPEHATVDAWAEAIGPGGATLAHAGSADQPIAHGGGPVHELAAPVVATTAPEPTPEPVHESHDDSAIWIGVGIGIGVVVVAAAVILGVVLGTPSSSDQTQPGVPVVRF
jgi:hypothetical protein